MLAVQTLFRSASLFVGDASCRAGRTGFGGDEVPEGFEVILPRRGVFIGSVRGQRLICDPNHAIFLDRTEPYRIRHPIEGGDRSTVIGLAASSLRDVLRSLDLPAADRERLSFGATHQATDAASDLIHRRLLALASAEGRCDLGVEEMALALVGRILAFALRSTPAPAAPRALHRQRALADAAKEFLAIHYAERVLLQDLAAKTACSPYHLSRVFHQYVGVPIHRYQTRLRIRAAEERLAQGESDLTRLAMELGFADHAHFTHAFRRETDQLPSSFRRLACQPQRPATSDAMASKRSGAT